jgi:hypothetical protein
MKRPERLKSLIENTEPVFSTTNFAPTVNRLVFPTTTPSNEFVFTTAQTVQTAAVTTAKAELTVATDKTDFSSDDEGSMTPDPSPDLNVLHALHILHDQSGLNAEHESDPESPETSMNIPISGNLLSVSKLFDETTAQYYLINQQSKKQFIYRL